MNRTAVFAAVFLVSLSASAAIPRKSVWRPGAESVAAMLKLPPEARHRALADQPDSVYKTLIEIADNKEQSMNMRWRALTSAALLRKNGAVPDLMKAAKSDQWFMRNAALVGLSEFSPEKAVAAARDLVKDPALVVRSAAVDVLVKHGSADERFLLWSELKEKYNHRGSTSLWIRAQIVKALAQKPLDGEMTNFSALLNEKDEDVQKGAIAGLEKLTGMRLGEGMASHDRVVTMWKNYFQRPETSVQR